MLERVARNVIVDCHGMVASFEELRAWQLAAELRDRIVAITATPVFRQDFGFRDQLTDAACSAAGCGRWRWTPCKTSPTTPYA